MFSHLYGLDYLDLSGNLLTQIDDGAFDSNRRLGVLHLHDNELNELSDQNMEAIQSLELLHTLRLYDNPWTCPCDNSTSFKNWLLHFKPSINIFNSAGILCVDHNVSLLKIPDEQFLC